MSTPSHLTLIISFAQFFCKRSCAVFLEFYDKYVKREKVFLWYSEIGIITRLRSEHIKLNLYNSVMCGNCDSFCNYCRKLEVLETVRHFLIDSPKYEKQRNEMRQALIEIDINFKNEKNFNARRLLFPHWYQKNPGKIEKLYDRVNILKLVCQYVSSTLRFKDDDKNSIYNMYELDLKDKISQKMDDMKEMVEKIMVDYDDEYNDEGKRDEI